MKLVTRARKTCTRAFNRHTPWTGVSVVPIECDVPPLRCARDPGRRPVEGDAARRRLARSLEAQQRFVESVFEHLPAMIIIKDPATLRVVVLNQVDRDAGRLRLSLGRSRAARLLLGADGSPIRDRELIVSTPMCLVFVEDAQRKWCRVETERDRRAQTAEFQPHGVLSDFSMPHLAGWTAHACVRACVRARDRPEPAVPVRSRNHRRGRLDPGAWAPAAARDVSGFLPLRSPRTQWITIGTRGDLQGRAAGH